MSKLVSRSALFELATPGRYGNEDGAPGVVIAEQAGLGLATLAVRKGQDAKLKAMLRKVYGVALPSRSTMVQGKDVSFIGYGPGQWLAVSPAFGAEALATDLAARFEGLASISDQSGGRAVLRISGPRARDLLAKGLAIDLDPRVFPPGSAATSTISHMGVQLWQGDDAQSFDLAIFRSVSESFWRWLTDCAGEYGYEVVPSA